MARVSKYGKLDLNKSDTAHFLALLNLADDDDVEMPFVVKPASKSSAYKTRQTDEHMVILKLSML